MRLLKHKILIVGWLLLLYLRHLFRLSGQADKAQLINSLKTERNDLETMINVFDKQKMVEIDTEVYWSKKDLMAYITTWDKRGTNWIKVASQGKIPIMPADGYTWEDMDKLNQQTFVEYKDCSLVDVASDFHHSYIQLLEQVQSLSEQQIKNPLVIELITWRYKHYRTHARQIQTRTNQLHT